MKLFLASSLNQTMQKFDACIEGGLRGKTVLFVANAADPYDGTQEWVEDDRVAFEKFGCTVQEADLRTFDEDKFCNLLDTSDIIHFCGGSVLYLMSLIREKGLEDVLKEYVLDEKIIYSGTSAGSMIPAQDLNLNRFEDEEAEFVGKMSDWSGLGFVNFSILPHAGTEYFVESNKKMIGHLPEYPQAVVVLFDNQAVWCSDGKFEVIEISS
ncbi:MAG: type 1 glutamine amidotransferase-like domain-containing protein [Candidatus Yonathbacteria bacterium]|nr:type 1 glutamine amidotransferase-like domain-containing protein [Candidatus Yonathbacteria bacterium]